MEVFVVFVHFVKSQDVRVVQLLQTLDFSLQNVNFFLDFLLLNGFDGSLGVDVSWFVLR